MYRHVCFSARRTGSTIGGCSSKLSIGESGSAGNDVDDALFDRDRLSCFLALLGVCFSVLASAFGGRGAKMFTVNRRVPESGGTRPIDRDSSTLVVGILYIFSNVAP